MGARCISRGATTAATWATEGTGGSGEDEGGGEEAADKGSSGDGGDDEDKGEAGGDDARSEDEEGDSGEMDEDDEECKTDNITVLEGPNQGSDQEEEADQGGTITTLQLQAEHTKKRRLNDAGAVAMHRLAPSGWSGGEPPLGTSGLRVVGFNHGRAMNPFRASGKYNEENVLQPMRDLVTSNVADVVIAVEGHIPPKDAPTIKMFVEHGGAAAALVAPCSTMAAKALGELCDGSSPAAGIVVVLAPHINERVRMKEQRMAGRLLHFVVGDGTSIDRDRQPVHFIAVYGVSGEAGTNTLGAQFATDLAIELEAHWPGFFAWSENGLLCFAKQQKAIK